MAYREFWQFENPYDLLRKRQVAPPGFTADEFYRRELSQRTQHIHQGERVSPETTQLIAEWRHVRSGRPYCKVHPAIAEMLGNTSINIESSVLCPPLPVFEVRLPKYGNPFQERPDTPPLRSILLAFNPGTFSELMTLPRGGLQIANDETRLWIWMDFGEMVDGVDGPTRATEFVSFDLVPGKTVAECLDALPPAQAGMGYNPSPAFKRSGISLAVSTCFFIEGKHELVAPDISPRLVERYRKAPSSGEREKVIKRSRQLGEGWWDLGREVELPRPKVVDRTPSATGVPHPWESRYSHVRSGHMRRQPFGPRSAPQFKIIFIAPTVVRPDLPERIDTRFVIKDDVLPSESASS